LHRQREGDLGQRGRRRDRGMRSLGVRGKDRLHLRAARELLAASRGVKVDGCGDVSQLAHENAMKRVVQAGAKPVTALSVMLEWQRDWANKDTYDAVMEIVKTHCGAYGIGVEYAYTMVHGAPATKFPEYAVPAAVAAHK